jgi:hypothetical protein
MNIAFNTAATSMMSAQARFSEAAQNVVVAATEGTDTVQHLVEMKQAQAVQQASATMLMTASDMTDRLLDIAI